ncbi:MAG: class I SAM-dependent methyltransferase [Magnetococcales bacterium]|nr:class I SAM-dependent methyltransferase [Magnetococcales bacterium]
MNLWSQFLSYQDIHRPTQKMKYYFPVYERYFRDFIYKPVTILEIGCWKGGSMLLWKNYFGPQATIIGVDINPACKAYEEDQIHIRIGAQQDPQFLQSLLDEFGVPDIILDDGSHFQNHVIATFEYLYPRMNKNGIYMVEDMHAAYWQEFEGGYQLPTTFIEKAKKLVDELNADHTRGALPPSPFTRSTMGIHFYGSMVVFERCAPRLDFSMVMPAKAALLEDFVANLIQLDDQGNTSGIADMVRFETSPVFLLEAIEVLLAQTRTRPAYVIAAMLHNVGVERWLISFSLAVGSVLFQLHNKREQYVQQLTRLSSEASLQRRNELSQKYVIPVIAPLLEAAIATEDVGRVTQWFAVLKSCSPDLLAVPGPLPTVGVEAKIPFLADARSLLQRLRREA